MPWNYVELIRFVLGMTKISSYVFQCMTIELHAAMFTLLYVWMRLFQVKRLLLKMMGIVY